MAALCIWYHPCQCYCSMGTMAAVISAWSAARCAFSTSGLVVLILPKALLSACKPPQNPRPVTINLCFPFCSEVTKQNTTPASHSSKPTGNHKSEDKHNIQRELAKGQALGWAEGLGNGNREPVKPAIRWALTHSSNLDGRAPAPKDGGKLRVRVTEKSSPLSKKYIYAHTSIFTDV